MIRYFLFTAISLFSLYLKAQEISGEDLLNKTIAYHDPNGAWSSFSGSFHVRMETPDGTTRKSAITINLPQSFFSVTSTKAEEKITQTIAHGNCTILINGKELTETEKAEKGNTCERAAMFKNYYTYLYGLPMKLKDKGTHVDEKVVRTLFKGKEYLRLKVTYDKSVGKDTWYFYFNPKNYAMEVYQFFHDESKNDGEYILLSDTEEIQGIKMPKNRAWYYNKEDGYLGTDILSTRLQK